MSWFTGFLVFVMVWWVVIFMVLPWGVRRTEQPAPGHEPGAPQRPLLVRKLLVTTAISAVIWLAIYLVVDSELISFREIARQTMQQQE